MAGTIRKLEWKNPKGQKVERYQARYPNPRKVGAKIERSFRTKKDAQRWITEQDASLHRGSWVDPRGADRLFPEIADEWRETWADLGPKTRLGYESILRHHLTGDEGRFAGTRLGAITTKEIQDYVNELADEGKAPNTLRRIFTVLRSCLRVAVERGYLAANPCDSVRLPRKRKGPGTKQLFLTPAEVRKLAEKIDPHYRVAVYVAAYCGLRAGEQWALRRRDLDPLHGTLTVSRALQEINSTAESLAEDKGMIFGPPKSDAARRTLTIPSPIRTLLHDHLASTLPGGNGPNDLVFTTKTGAPIRQSLFYKRQFRPTVKKALPDRLHGLRWHDLRHTAASLSLAVEPNLHTVKVRLGHEDIHTTVNTYGHLLPSADAALADGLAAMFDGAENVRELREPATATGI